MCTGGEFVITDYVVVETTCAVDDISTVYVTEVDISVRTDSSVAVCYEQTEVLICIKRFRLRVVITDEVMRYGDIST